MRERLAPLLILCAAAFLGWWLVAGGQPDAPSPRPLPADEASEPARLEPRPLAPEPPQPVVPAPEGVRTPDPEPGTSLTAEEIRALPRGELVVRVVDGNGDVRGADGVNVRVQSKGRSDWATRLPERDPEQAIFRFSDLLAGEVEVTVMGEAIAEAQRTVTVRQGSGSELSIPTQDGAAVSFKIERYDESTFESATVRVLGENGQPVTAWFEGTGMHLRAARKGQSAAMGAEGRVYGLRPGRYVLEVVIEEGAESQEAFVAQVAQRAEVTLRVR